MNATKRVVRNSLWLVVQPLILNLISLFVIGYIARTLGQVDYGKFTFAFSYVAMFLPIINLGISSVITRDITEDRVNAGRIIGKVLILRLLLSLLAVVLAVVVINILHYPQNTKLVVYMAGSMLLFSAVSNTLNSAFQGFEKMEYVAKSQFLSGLILTALSVVVLYAGFGLKTLTLVYCFGNMLGTIIALWFLYKRITKPVFEIDLVLWKSTLMKAIPFFIPLMVGLLGEKMGVILLTKISGDAAMGVYGAASGLVERLVLIPDGICTAIYPTMAALYMSSRQEAVVLFKRFHLYAMIIGMPIAIGTTILADPLIQIVYGAKYASSAIILRILIWWFFFLFLNMLQVWTLGAIHQEKKGVTIVCISTPVFILLNLLLIPIFAEKGYAAATLISVFLSFSMSLIFICRYLRSKMIDLSVIVRLLGANVVMGLFTYLFRHNIIVITIPVSAGNLLGIVYFRVITRDEVRKLWSMISEKFSRDKDAATVSGQMESN
jgi:O-antigen/teichoic acid export membrane protein